MTLFPPLKVERLSKRGLLKEKGFGHLADAQNWTTEEAEGYAYIFRDFCFPSVNVPAMEETLFQLGFEPILRQHTFHLYYNKKAHIFGVWQAKRHPNSQWIALLVLYGQYNATESFLHIKDNDFSSHKARNLQGDVSLSWELVTTPGSGLLLGHLGYEQPHWQVSHPLLEARLSDNPAALALVHQLEMCTHSPDVPAWQAWDAKYLDKHELIDVLVNLNTLVSVEDGFLVSKLHSNRTLYRYWFEIVPGHWASCIGTKIEAQKAREELHHISKRSLQGDDYLPTCSLIHQVSNGLVLTRKTEPVVITHESPAS